jgi:hypothetical protein
MVELKKFTKQQQFSLVSTALADTWFELRQNLSDSDVVEFKTNQLSLNFSKLGFQVTVLRPNGLILYTLSLVYTIDNSLVYDFIPYKRNKPVFGKDIQGYYLEGTGFGKDIPGYYSEETGFEWLSSELSEEFFVPFIDGILELVSKDKVLFNTFENCLARLVKGVPSAKQLERRREDIKANPRKELRDLFLRMSKVYKYFLKDSALCENEHIRSISGAAVRLNKVGFYYTVIVSSKELYTFTISTTDENDQYSHNLTNRKGVLTTFTDSGIFYDDADYLASFIPNKDILDFIMVFEGCFAKLGLGLKGV